MTIQCYSQPFFHSQIKHPLHNLLKSWIQFYPRNKRHNQTGKVVNLFVITISLPVRLVTEYRTLVKTLTSSSQQEEMDLTEDYTTHRELSSLWIRLSSRIWRFLSRSNFSSSICRSASSFFKAACLSFRISSCS